MKKHLISLLKLFISGILASFILCIFCFFYDNSPIAVVQPDGYTNYKFNPDTNWSFMTEGFGFGRTNNIGYNSADDISFSDPIIAFLGSSQTEALQVQQDKNFVSLTRDALHSDTEKSNDYPCVNLGISSHFFNVCISKFSSFLDTFENPQYVVIETGNLVFTEEELDKMLNEAYHDPYIDKGTLNNVMRRIPLIRTLKNQYELVSRTELVNDAPENITSMDYAVYEDKMEKIIQKLQVAASEKDLQIIILYHNAISVDTNGSSFRTDDAKILEIVRKCCITNNVSFIDATEQFLVHYQETCQMPYGFANTVPGVGHLNETGHKIIAELVYQQITELTRRNPHGIQ